MSTTVDFWVSHVRGGISSGYIKGVLMPHRCCEIPRYRLNILTDNYYEILLTVTSIHVSHVYCTRNCAAMANLGKWDCMIEKEFMKTRLAYVMIGFIHFLESCYIRS